MSSLRPKSKADANLPVASSYIFANFQIQEETNTSPSSRTIPTFLALYSFGFIYELVLVYDALRMKNTIQVIGLCACNFGLLIYGAVQVRQIQNAVSVLSDMDKISPVVWAQSQPFLIIIPCIVALGSLLMTFVAWKLYDEFAWTIYKHISADLRMKRRYLTYQIYIALLKFDFFFFLGFTVQFLVVVSSSKHDAEFYLTIIAVPVTIIILLCGAFFVRREFTAGMIVIIVSRPATSVRSVANQFLNSCCYSRPWATSASSSSACMLRRLSLNTFLLAPR
jgi:hypothetical protein